MPADLTCTLLLVLVLTPGSTRGQLSVESGALADPQLLQLDYCPNAHSSEQLYIEVSEKVTFVYLLCVNVICVTLSCVDMLVCVCVCVCTHGHWDNNVL